MKVLGVFAYDSETGQFVQPADDLRMRDYDGLVRVATPDGQRWQVIGGPQSATPVINWPEPEIVTALADFVHSTLPIIAGTGPGAGFMP